MACRVAGLLEHDEPQVEQRRERALASGDVRLLVSRLGLGFEVGHGSGLGIGQGDVGLLVEG